MIKKIMLLGLMASCVRSEAPAQAMEFHVQAQQHAKINLLLALVGEAPSPELIACAQVVKKDMEFSGTFNITVKNMQSVSTANELKALNTQGYPLVLFMNENKRGTAIEWRMYDTTSTEMIKGKNYHKRGDTPRGWAHQLADAVWPELTAQEGFFCTKIAYCKQVKGKNRPLNNIYIADFNNDDPHHFIAGSTLAPRFSADVCNPMLFYSDNTRSNVCLKTASMDKVIKKASNFNGFNMCPTFCDDAVAYCASHGSGSCHIYVYKDKKLSRLTSNTGNNISPSFAHDGSFLYFCSDYKEGRPHIYKLDMKSGAEQAITSGAESSFCPSYCSKKKQLAYTKMMQGVAQIFLYDETTGKHKQLTFDRTTKDECCWSPCGNYLMYSVQKSGQGRIAILSLLTGQEQLITGANENCSYPTWSPRYEQYPVIA